MFEISALPLQTPAPSPAVIAANPGAAPFAGAEIPGLSEAATAMDGAPSFQALLARQSAPVLPAPAQAVSALPESGKILPEAAEPLAATAKRSEPGREVPATQDEEPEARTAPLPDLALVAALFAAPDRLPVAPIQAERPGTPATPLRSMQNASAPAGPSPAQAPAMAASFLASTAQIELQPEASPEPAPEAPAGEVAAQQASAPVARQLAQRSRNPAASADAPTPDTFTIHGMEKDPALADAPAPKSENRSIANAEQPPELRKTHPAQSASSTAAPERIDFATLVDTLARAREEASPHRITVSVGHADFGRVALRFDQDENRGMQVAMSSADPGFARAVAATMEPAPGSGSTTGQSAGSAPSHQQGEPSRQHQQQQAEGARLRPERNGNPAASAETQARNSARDGRGIYA
jgi:hypothetical protein